MPNITIKEILAADSISEAVDKINFNFDQLLLNGGGPVGPIGGPGEIGPLGPRGTIWFTVADLYTTPTSPMWTGTPERVNDINAPNYPQYKGDPNKFLPIGLGGPVENTLIFGNVNKLLRDGDLYIQESDDTLNSFNSLDGDIWEFDNISQTWLYTGVNIKGDQGQSGSSGFSQWTRFTDTSTDLLYPTPTSGQDTPKILIGEDINIEDFYNPLSSLTISSSILHISLGNPLIHNISNNNISESGHITMTSDGVLVIQGSNTSELIDTKEIIIRSFNDMFLLSGDASEPIPTQYNQLYSQSEHRFIGGRLTVKGRNINDVNHRLLNGELSDIGINIILKPTGASNLHRINTDNLHDLVLQGTTRKVGIGIFNSTNPVGSKLSVDGNVSIGAAYKSLTNGPTNGLIVQGNTGIGTNDLVISARLTVEQETGAASSGVVIRNGSSTRSPNMIRLIGFDNINTWGLGLNNDDSFRLRDNSSAADRIVVTQAGRVGIGNSTPSTRLSVYDNTTNIEVIRVSSNGGSGSIQGKSYIGLDFLADDGNKISPVRLGVEQTSSDTQITGLSGFRGAFVIQTRPDSIENQLPETRLAVMPNGNVGIGTVNVLSPLQVQATGIVTGTLNPWDANINPSIRITSTATGLATIFPGIGTAGTSRLNTITGGKIITSAVRSAGFFGNTDFRSLTIYGRTFIDLTQPATTWGKTASEPALTIGTGAGIFQSAINQLQLATNNIERVRINPNGGVQLYDNNVETLGALSLPADGSDAGFVTWGAGISSTNYDRTVFIRTVAGQQQLIRSGIEIRIRLIGGINDSIIFEGTLGDHGHVGVSDYPPQKRVPLTQWNYNFILPAGLSVQFEYQRRTGYQRFLVGNNYNIAAYRLGKK
jgi:hypothetical protein